MFVWFASSHNACQPNDFIAHNVAQLTRVYPGPKRFDSSNFNPFAFWTVGIHVRLGYYINWSKYCFWLILCPWDITCLIIITYCYFGIWVLINANIDGCIELSDVWDRDGCLQRHVQSEWKLRVSGFIAWNTKLFKWELFISMRVIVIMYVCMYECMCLCINMVIYFKLVYIFYHCKHGHHLLSRL